MHRRSRYALTKVSADLPTLLVQQLDAWKAQIKGINRSQLMGDLLTWALRQGAIDALYPQCAAGHEHDGPEGQSNDCDCSCPTCEPLSLGREVRPATGSRPETPALGDLKSDAGHERVRRERS